MAIEKSSRQEILRILIEISGMDESMVAKKLDLEYITNYIGTEREFIPEFHAFLHHLIAASNKDENASSQFLWMKQMLAAKIWLSAILKSDEKLQELYSVNINDGTTYALDNLFEKLKSGKRLTQFKKEPWLLLPNSEWERKVRKPISPKMRALLQKESQSRCPFCSNEDVQHHEVHHIDENPANNDAFNLILICRNCHGKITQGAISMKDVIIIKNNITTASSGIEIAAIQIDPQCAWDVSEENPVAFFKGRDSNKHENPVLNITIINHQSRTIILHEIEPKVKGLYSGMSGPPPEPRVLKPLARYKIHIPGRSKKSKLAITEQIELPSGRPAQFQIEVAGYKGKNDKTHKVSGRKVLFFKLGFSSNFKVTIPPVFINSVNANEGITLVRCL